MQTIQLVTFHVWHEQTKKKKHKHMAGLTAGFVSSDAGPRANVCPDATDCLQSSDTPTTTSGLETENLDVSDPLFSCVLVYWGSAPNSSLL